MIIHFDWLKILRKGAKLRQANKCSKLRYGNLMLVNCNKKRNKRSFFKYRVDFFYLHETVTRPAS